MSSFENHPLHPGNRIPLFISAGVLKEPAQLTEFIEADEADAMPVLTLGGFGMTYWRGNAKPGETDFVYYPEIGKAGNSRGLPNGGGEAIKKLKEPIRKLTELGIKTILQVTNLPHEKPLDVVRRLVLSAAEVNPTAIEFNLSCPNGKKSDGTYHAPTCNDAEASGEIMAAGREELGPGICLGAKDGPHVISLEDEMDEAGIKNLASTISPYIDFLTGINTIGNQLFPELVCGGGRGGMSGPIVAPVANQHLRLWRRYAPDVAYLSCGGVDSSNAGEEVPKRLANEALLVGGAQEYYRAHRKLDVVAAWSIKWAYSAFAD